MANFIRHFDNVLENLGVTGKKVRHFDNDPYLNACTILKNRPQFLQFLRIMIHYLLIGLLKRCLFWERNFRYITGTKTFRGFYEKGDKFTYFMALIGALILTPGMIKIFLLVFKKIQIFVNFIRLFRYSKMNLKSYNLQLFFV